MAGLIGIILKHNTTKHMQTIGLLERSRASVMQALKVEAGERRSLWHEYVIIAVLNYYTSYNASIGCEQSRVFHGRNPYNVVDLKTRIRPQKLTTPCSRSAQDLLERTEMIYQDVRKNAMQVHIKHKAYYEKKTNASKLEEIDYFYVLQPKTKHQESKILFTELWCFGPYSNE